MNLCNPNVIKALMNEFKVNFRKDYGQNFLINEEVPEAIAEICAKDAEYTILEIGPGIGCLTQELCRRYQKVLSVEIDKGMIPILQKTLAEYSNVHVENADFMTLSLPSFLANNQAGRKLSVAANLPYYITTPILMKLLESGVHFDQITVMVQKEVGDRLTSKPGSSDYGAITAVLNYYGEVEKCLSVPAGCFMPAPKVDSVVIQLSLYQEKKYLPKDEKFLFAVIHGAFEQRRKTLANALETKLKMDKKNIKDALASLHLSETVRGEKLSIEEFVTLSNILFEMK